MISEDDLYELREEDRKEELGYFDEVKDEEEEEDYDEILSKVARGEFNKNGN